MSKYGLALVFLVLFQFFAFAQSPRASLSVGLGAPIDLWSYNAEPGDSLKSNDVSISFGVSGKYFWNNNFGIFGNLHGTTLLFREEERGGVKRRPAPPEKIKTSIGLFISAGPAYRIPLGASAGLYIGVGPSYTLYVLEARDYVAARGTRQLASADKLLHMLGVAVEPGIIVNLGRNLVFDASVSLGFNLLRLQKMETIIAGRIVPNDGYFDQYFGFTISPHIGIGYSF